MLRSALKLVLAVEFAVACRNQRPMTPIWWHEGHVRNAMSSSAAISKLSLFGRTRELAKLQRLVESKTPALVHGAAGAGKTRLLLHLHEQLAARGTDVLYVRFEQSLHAFFLSIADKLSVECGKTSSVSLRGALWKAFEARPRIILLDDIREATPPYYRFFQRVLAAGGNSIVGAALHEHAAGALRHIFWNPQSTIPLGNLSKRDSNALIEASMSAFLRDVQLPPDFAVRVGNAARGNPGRIVEICMRAANPVYHSEDQQIRFGALVMDSLTGLLP